MNQLLTALRIIGQFILILIFGLTGGFLFEFRIPGHHTFTDDDAGPLTLVYEIFIIVGFGLLLNSFIFKLNNHWSRFRIGVIVFVVGFGLAVFLPKNVVKWTFLGEKKMEFTSIENSDFIWVKLELYQNNNFLYSS